MIQSCINTIALKCFNHNSISYFIVIPSISPNFNENSFLLVAYLYAVGYFYIP
ncbi:hypothetical protein A1OE_1394 [Candidatus Endolissoclinum faulkneri L2]|uniref:Uncharacterized protein n=1 Tax=Candidatus Endolissoclinum faulkneri L2 TaxID=1193729 RepID=K7Z611_9PROT|nr:hypothetical protein A1OE_1394 [Candidatus Endolissoclinum faulkneri L2]